MTRKLTEKEIARHESTRDVWQEVLDSIDEIKAGRGKRSKIAPRTMVARVRIQSGLSQSQFAEILGVSKRTLEQWEQGRREPSGAARTLIKIAASRPEIFKEIAAH